MTFEFVIAYQQEDGVAIDEIILTRLRDVLTANLNEFDDDTTARMLVVNYERCSEPETRSARVS